MNKIDKIYIINLKERTDRWQHCLKQLNKYNITNFTRFDAVKPDLNKVNPIQYSKNNLKKLTNGHTTHAYLLNRSFFQNIINEILKCYCEIDVCYAKMQKKYNHIYGIYPCLITQMESYSDILNKNVNYDQYIKLDNK